MKSALLLPMLGAVLAGCAWSGAPVTSRANHPPPRQISVPGCLPTAPQLVNLDVGTEPFIRPGAVALRLCEYYGFNWGGRPRALRRDRLIRNAATIAGVIRRFDALPLNRRGTFHCPNDDGSELGLVFGYPGRSTSGIAVQLTGCGEAVSKLSGRDTTLRLRDMLVRLVRG
jgi:hypothetical protein